MLSEATCPAKPTRRALLASLPLVLTGQTKRPNILILHSDDQRADTIGAWGNRYIDTPNLDRLVKCGVSFRNCYNQGGHQPAVCVASRAMLMSGKSLWRATAKDGLNGPLMPERFAEAGYRTFFTGKWHNGAETLNRSFQSGGLVHLGGMGPQIQPKLQNFRSSRTESRNGRATPLFADSLQDYLRSSVNDQKPFFAYCAFTAPHDPREARPEDSKRYRSRGIPLPRPWFPAPQTDNGELSIRDEMVVPPPRTREQYSKELADYYGLISELDENIGRILKTLEDQSRLENTIVVFAADNGLAMGAHGLMGKQSMYEHSIKVPLIMAGPGIRNQTDRKPAYLYELYSRLCKAVDLSVPSEVEAPGAPMYFAYRDFQRAIRIGSRKMTWSAKAIEQYDLELDPHEEHNLSGTSEAWPDAPFLTRRAQAAKHFGDPKA